MSARHADVRQRKWPAITLAAGEGSDGKHIAFFSGVDTASFRGLWVTNGTTAGTFELTGIIGAFTGGVTPSELTVFNGEVLFQGEDTAGHLGLWVTNGTAAGTFELTGISGAYIGGISPGDLTDFNGEVLFEGDDTASHLGLWVTNGTAAGTFELTNIMRLLPVGSLVMRSCGGRLVNAPFVTMERRSLAAIFSANAPRVS